MAMRHNAKVITNVDLTTVDVGDILFQGNTEFLISDICQSSKTFSCWHLVYGKKDNHFKHMSFDSCTFTGIIKGKIKSWKDRMEKKK